MERVAQTKGAISNAEMTLFASSAPSDYDDESVWIAWLDRKIQMQEIFMNRILNPNARLTDLDAPLSETMPGFVMTQHPLTIELISLSLMKHQIHNNYFLEAITYAHFHYTCA